MTKPNPELSREERIQELLTRGTDKVYPSKEAFHRILRGKKRQAVYLGIDPSSPDVHIGHLVVLQKMRHFQNLGHKVILLVGDFTGQTGDPSDKAAVRQPLTKQQVRANAKSYRKQASKILKFSGKNPAEIKYNSEWLGELNFQQVAELAGHFTVQQLLERDMFEQRLNANKPISLREFIYPLMQGYDSVAMNVDVEVGGSDQTFNMLAGRKLFKEYKGKDKYVVTVPLLADANGIKIGKTEGNAIAIDGKPAELYGQIMSLPDEVIMNAYEWCTSASGKELEEVGRIAKENPRDAKMRLAYRIITEVQGEDAAKKGQAAFVRVFQKKEKPSKLKSWRAPSLAVPLWKVLKESELVASSSEAHRMIQQGAVSVNDIQQSDPNAAVKTVERPIVKVGKRKFMRITPPLGAAPSN
ncbi:tyrosine--tRNA ligase [Patescibacteria group bacterium]|nr:tyrosine--tRNA ligase [Patescibacteria group bacterium]